MSRQTVLFLGDTHGDTEAIEEGFAAAARSNAAAVVSVGDLWYQPRTDTFNDVVSSVLAGIQHAGCPLYLVDGNNDDADALLGDGEAGSTVEVGDGFIYASRGATWNVEGVSFAAFGGAVTFRRDGRTVGVDLFNNEVASDLDLQRALKGGRVDVLVTHDAPEGAPMPKTLKGGGPDEVNRKRVLQVLEARTPNLVVHGHYHASYEGLLNDTRIVGLGRDKVGVPAYKVVDLADLVAREHVGYTGAA